jgi:hypothetical protein
MSFAVFTRRTVVATVAVAIALSPLVACKRKDETPPPMQPYPYPAAQPQPYGYPPPQQPYPYPPQPAPWAPPQPPQHSGPTLPPSFGFFCATDNDMQCLYGRCLGGRCGGCSDASQCKRGAACVPSPVGMTCWAGPGGGNAPPPAPPPIPPPAPPGPTPSFPPPAPPPPNASDPFARARQICVDRINGYRARLSRAPVARDPSGEPCADEQSRLDGRSNSAHGTFGRCSERAQNACPNYPGPLEESLVRCLDQMFAEGPGGGHYENIINAKYTRAFCGFEAMSGGRFWMIQDFR